MKQIFLPGDKLEEWSDKGQVQINGNVAVIIEKNLQYGLEEAVRFTKCLSSEDDPRGLTGKVLTKQQLNDLNAEHYSGSVIMDDDAYEVAEGFLGNLIEGDAPVAVAEVSPAPPEKTEEKIKPQPEKPVEKIADEPEKKVEEKTEKKQEAPAKTEKSGDDVDGEKSDVELLTEYLLDNM